MTIHRTAVVSIQLSSKECDSLCDYLETHCSARSLDNAEDVRAVVNAVALWLAVHSPHHSTTLSTESNE